MLDCNKIKNLCLLFQVLDHPDGGAMLVTNYVDMGSLGRQAGELGQQLAKWGSPNLVKKIW